MNELQKLYRASYAKRTNSEPLADYGDYATYTSAPSYDSSGGADDFDSDVSSATDFTSTDSDSDYGTPGADDSTVADYANYSSSSTPSASSSGASISPAAISAAANLAAAALKVAVIVTGHTSTGSPVVAPENTNALIAGLIAQGQNQTAALDAAVMSLKANGVDTTSPFLQQQMNAAAAAAAAQVAAAAGANGTGNLSMPVLLLMLGVAGVAVYMSQK